MLALRHVLVLVIALICALPSYGQDRRLDEARARWEQLSPAEQARMRDRFERLRSMPANDRASLEDRAKFLAEAIRRVEERMTPEIRQRVARLDPERRRALLRDLAMIDGGDRAARIHGALPDSWREKLERVPAEQRARMLLEFEGQMRERGREKIVELLTRKYGLSAADIARLDALPQAERMAELAKLKRAHGLGDTRGPERGPDGERGRPGHEAMAGRMKLLEAARPRPSDHLRYAELSIGERRELVAKIVRERVVVALRENQLATPTEIEALERLPLDDFRRALRERFSNSRGRHGDRPEDPRGR